MRPIATINGVNVYSDKELTAIQNTRVTFSDGSWCDAATGEVVNKGHGSISIGSASRPAPGEQISVGPVSYRATALRVIGVDADVEISPNHDSELAIVAISGEKSDVENIRTSQQGDLLVLSSKRDGPRSGANVVISSSNISIGGMRGGVNIVAGRSIVKGSAGGAARVKIRIGVSLGSLVQVIDVDGNVKVGDINGPFTGSQAGDGDMHVGKVRDTQLTVQGSGNIDVAEVNGALTMTVQGSGDIRVARGDVGMLIASIMGSGDASFGGSANDAVLAVMGSGDIDVRQVKNRPVRNRMGTGSIGVGNW